MKAFIIAVIITAIALYAILFLPADLNEGSFKVDSELTEQIDESLHREEMKRQEEVLKEMIRMQEEINDIYRELIELEELKLKLQTGKAWSA